MDCGKCTALVWDVDSREGGVCSNFVLSAEFFCNHKTSLKKKVFFNELLEKLNLKRKNEASYFLARSNIHKIVVKLP